MKTKYFFALTIILSILSVSFAQLCAAQQSLPTVTGPPESIEDLKNIGLKALDAFPAAFKAALDTAMSFFNTLFERAKDIWNKHFAVIFNLNLGAWTQKIKAWISQREAIFKQEFPKKWQELKQAIREFFSRILKSIIPPLPSLWEKMKELFKK